MTEELESRISALEISHAFSETQSVVRKEQMKMLEELRKIRAALIAGGGGSVDKTNSEELEALQKENEELKRKNVKHQYRITILLRAIEEADDKLNS